jgi:hypothetical protein
VGARAAAGERGSVVAEQEVGQLPRADRVDFGSPWTIPSARMKLTATYTQLGTGQGGEREGTRRGRGEAREAAAGTGVVRGEEEEGGSWIGFGPGQMVLSHLAPLLPITWCQGVPPFILTKQVLPAAADRRAWLMVGPIVRLQRVTNGCCMA